MGTSNTWCIISEVFDQICNCCRHSDKSNYAVIGRPLLFLEFDARAVIRLVVLYCNINLELSDVMSILNY